MIDYEQQLIRFMQLATEINLSSGAQLLYFHLITLIRTRFYANTFKIDNETLSKRANISLSKLKRSRNELQAQSLIDYKSGGGSASGEYTIIDLLNVSKATNKNYMNENLTDVEIDLINRNIKHFDAFSNETKTMARFIYEVVQKAIKNQSAGVFGNKFQSVQQFINAKSVITAPFIFKLTKQIEGKKDIRDLPSYILTAVSNFVDENKKELVRGG